MLAERGEVVGDAAADDAAADDDDAGVGRERHGNELTARAGPGRCALGFATRDEAIASSEHSYPRARAGADIRVVRSGESCPFNVKETKS